MLFNKMKCFRFLTVLLILASLCCPSNCYPNGPPQSVCQSGLPMHMKDGKVVMPQKHPSPYVIEVNATTFRPGETIDVTLKSYVGQAFRGLFLQVVPIPKHANDSVDYSPVGLYERNIRNIKLMTCRYMLDTLTHSHRFMKYQTSFKWRSPLIMKHNVVVRATVLKEFDVYWDKVESSVIELKYSGTLPAETLEKPWLKEIIKTVKASNDTETRRKLTRDRFERGLDHTLTPDGIVMVHMVTNILPFKDSPVPGYRATAHKPLDETEAKEMNKAVANITAAESDVADGSKQVKDSNVDTDVDNRMIETGDTNSTDNKESPDMTSDQLIKTNSINKDTMEKFYGVLVEALLHDDTEVANTLYEIVGDKTP